MAKSDLLSDLLTLARPLDQAAQASLSRHLSAVGVTARQFKLMNALALNGSMPVPDIARHLSVTRQYAREMVEDTTQSGLTQPRDNPRHSRSSLIVLTSKGAALVTELREREREVLHDIAARLDPQDLDTALSVAQHCYSALRRQQS